jgi:hypothetical protein
VRQEDWHIGFAEDVPRRTPERPFDQFVMPVSAHHKDVGSKLVRDLQYLFGEVNFFGQKEKLLASYPQSVQKVLGFL